VYKLKVNYIYKKAMIGTLKFLRKKPQDMGELTEILLVASELCYSKQQEFAIYSTIQNVFYKLGLAMQIVLCFENIEAIVHFY